MSRYGLNYYNLAYYGPDNPVSFVATNFTADPTDYGAVQLSWNSAAGEWSKVRLVRNPYGFPVNAFDGDVLVSAAKETDPTNYLDQNLLPGSFYYYSLFVFELTAYAWVRASNVIGLSVKDYNYRNKIYDSLPDIMKMEQIYDASGSLNNQDLYNFVSVFGFDLDRTHTLIALLEDRYNLERVSGLLIPYFLKQFGINFEPEVGLQQARIILRDAIENFKKKGSQDGLRSFIKSFTGYGVPEPLAGTPNPSTDGVIVGKNLFLDYNDSSFEESQGHWISSDSTATINSLVKKDVTQLSVTTSVAKLVIGTHNYKVNHKVTVSGSPYPAFNSSLPLTITAIDATSISVASTITSFAAQSGFNKVTEAYTQVAPYPAPYLEATAPTGYPNKQSGILSVRKTTGTGNTTIECGDDNPILKGIPITAGQQYTFSTYASSVGTVRGIVLKVKWYDRLGVLLSTSTGSSTTTVLDAFTARPTVTATAPANSYFAVPVVQITAADSVATEHHYFDGAQFEKSATVTAFEEARQLKLTLKATRINELKNPHFASPLTPWNFIDGSGSVNVLAQEPDADVYTITHYTVDSNVVRIETSVSHDIEAGSIVVISGLGSPYDGAFTVATTGINTVDALRNSLTFTYALTTGNISRTAVSGTAYRSGTSLRVSATGSTVVINSYTTNADYMDIHYPNTSYAFSVYAQILGGGQEEVTPEIIWYNSSKTVISSSVGTEYTVTASGTSWNRLSLIATAPSTAAYASVRLTWQVIDGSTLGLDKALFENVGVILPYFDGNDGPTDGTDLFWEGTAASSRSHLYKNRFAIQNRLTRELLSEYINLGSTFAIYLAQPKT
jgi:hypothetical protein